MDRLRAYDYSLPSSLIATEPATPRDASRLFVYDTKTDEISFDAFKHLPDHVPETSFFVFNDTRVVPARLHLEKPTGGKIEVFLLVNELRPGDRIVKGMVDRRAEVGWRLAFPSGAYLTVVRQEEQYFFFEPSVDMPALWALIERYGKTPVPKYIKGTDLPEEVLRKKYQSIFAQHPASVAAPTASLHFTDAVLDELRRRGVNEAHVTLHVGPGTFAPLTDEHFRRGKLHTEFARVGEGAAAAINAAKEDGRSVITVGTTAMRTVEYCAKETGTLTAYDGPVDLFIFPPYAFRVADILLTNFHLPKSSLMLLVDAFLRHKKARRSIVDLYAIAIEEKFRFYSFGDAMLVR